MARLNHLHLHVADVQRSRRFYETYFGLSEHVWHGDILFLRDDPDGLDLALAPASEVDALPDWFHFGFRLADAHQVGTTFNALEAANYVTHPLEEHEDFVFFRCRDPDGYQIEVYWE